MLFRKAKTIKRCPKCKSTRISLWTGGIMGLYFCKKCQYKGALIIEEDVEDLKKPKKNK